MLIVRLAAESYLELPAAEATSTTDEECLFLSADGSIVGRTERMNVLAYGQNDLLRAPVADMPNADVASEPSRRVAAPGADGAHAGSDGARAGSYSSPRRAAETANTADVLFARYARSRAKFLELEAEHHEVLGEVRRTRATRALARLEGLRFELARVEETEYRPSRLNVVERALDMSTAENAGDAT